MYYVRRIVHGSNRVLSILLRMVINSQNVSNRSCGKRINKTFYFPLSREVRNKNSREVGKKKVRAF